MQFKNFIIFSVLFFQAEVKPLKTISSLVPTSYNFIFNGKGRDNNRHWRLGLCLLLIARMNSDKGIKNYRRNKVLNGLLALISIKCFSNARVYEWINDLFANKLGLAATGLPIDIFNLIPFLLLIWLLFDCADGVDYLFNNPFRERLNSIKEALSKPLTQQMNFESNNKNYTVVSPEENTFSTDNFVLPKNLFESTIKSLRIFFDNSNPNNKDLSEGCGALFFGPPGTGKTVFAKALGKALNLPVIVTSGPAMHGFIQAEGPLIVRSTFSLAKRLAPCILIIDEMDTITTSRSELGADALGDNKRIIVNELLSAMDNLNTLPVNKRVFVIGTSNKVTGHDEALTRPGRLSLMVRFTNPVKIIREKIIQLYWQKYCPTTSLPQIAFDTLISLSAGQSPAKIEAAVKAVVKLINCSQNIEEKAIAEAIFNGSIGGEIDVELKATRSEEFAQMTAAHEAGHCIAALLNVSDATRLKCVSIAPRNNGTGGLTYLSPDDGELFFFKEALENEIAYLFGGCLGEEIFKNKQTHSTGVGRDFEQIKEKIQQMLQLGMLENVTTQSSQKKQAQAMENKFFEILNKTRALFQKPEIKAAVEALAKELSTKDFLVTKEILAIPEVALIVKDVKHKACSCPMDSNIDNIHTVATVT